MPKRSRKEIVDANLSAARVLRQMFKEAEAEGKDPLAVALGRRSGLKGGTWNLPSFRDVDDVFTAAEPRPFSLAGGFGQPRNSELIQLVRRVLRDRLFWLSALMVGVPLAIMFIRLQNEVPLILTPTGILAALITLGGPEDHGAVWYVAWIVVTQVVWTLIVFVTLKWLLTDVLRRH